MFHCPFFYSLIEEQAVNALSLLLSSFDNTGDDTMKIDKLILKDFKCFLNLSLALEKPINLIFGQNGSGKSTIAQAMEHTLTGKVNGLGSAKIKNSLVRSGAEEYSVSAVVSDKGRRLEMFQNSQERGPEIEIDKAVLACLLNSPRFLNEHPNDQKQLLFDLLGIEISEGTLKQHVQDWVKAHPEVLAKSWRPDGDFQELAGCLEEFPKSLSHGYEAACDERKLVKRELRAFEGISAKDLPKGLSSKDLVEKIRQKQEEFTELHTRIGETRGVALGEEKSLESEISTLSGQILQLESAIRSFNQEGAQAELNRLIAEKNNLDSDLNKPEEELHGLNCDLISLEALARGKEELAARLKNFTGLCPLFKEDRFTCQTRDVLEAVKQREVFASEDQKIQALRDNKERVLEMIDRKQKRHISVEGGIISHQSRSVPPGEK